MKLIIKIIGIFILLIGIFLLIKPEIIFNWIADNAESQSLYIFAIVIRIILGVLLIIAAKGSKYPVFIKIFGYITLIAAIVLIFIGEKGFQDMITSVFPNIKGYTVVIGLVAMALGAFLMYSVLENKKVNN
jgi:hypothetical protein